MTRKEELELDLRYYKNKIADTEKDIRKYETLVNSNLENLDNSKENLKCYKNSVKQIRERIKECECRLTKRAENGTAVYATPSGESVKWENNRHKVLQKLADYEDLEEQGRLLKLPCPIGTRVYKIREVYECDFNYNFKVCPKLCNLECGPFCDYNSFSRYELSKVKFNFDMLDEFNITIFLNKEEAEKALKRLEHEEATLD